MKRFLDSRGGSFLIEECLIGCPYRYLWTYRYWPANDVVLNSNSNLLFLLPKGFSFGESTVPNNYYFKHIDHESLSKFTYLDLYPEIEDSSVYYISSLTDISKHVNRSISALSTLLT